MREMTPQAREQDIREECSMKIPSGEGMTIHLTAGQTITSSAGGQRQQMR